MSSRIQVLRVVVASPADVKAERDLVSGVLEELNKSMATDRGVRLEAVRWETDAYPGFHPAGPQGLEHFHRRCIVDLIPAKLCGNPAMAKSYADDLRRKLLQAYDRGEGTLEQLAERFSVSVPWAWKISAQRKRSGQMERIEQRRGTSRKVTLAVQERLRGWVQSQPDTTLIELQQKLEKAQRLHVSLGRLWQVLRQMGLRLKKSHSTPANATRKPTSGGGKASRKRSPGSRRSG